MKDFFSRAWTPTAGALTSVSFKGISDISQKTPELVEAVQQMPPDQPALITYFYIGILGAVGGLLVKITWSAIKKMFPKLKNLDK